MACLMASYPLWLEPLEDRRLLSIGIGPTWVEQGPRAVLGGQTEGILLGREVIGAIEAIATRPTNADVAYVGAVHSFPTTCTVDIARQCDLLTMKAK